MGLQISRDFHPEVSKKDAVLPATPAPWRGVSQAGGAERMQSGGRTPDDRPPVGGANNENPRFYRGMVTDLNL